MPGHIPRNVSSTAGVLVTHQAGQAPAGRRYEVFPWCHSWPRRRWPARERIAFRHENGNGWPGVFPVPGQVPAISRGPEEPLTVVGPAEMSPAGAEEDIFGTRAPRLLGNPPSSRSLTRPAGNRHNPREPQKITQSNQKPMSPRPPVRP